MLLAHITQGQKGCLASLVYSNSFYYIRTFTHKVMINSEEQSEQDSLIQLLTEKEKVCLDAYLFNSSNRIEAYKLAKDITKDIDYVQLNSRANNWFQNKSCKAYLTKYKSVIVKTNPDETIDLENLENDFYTKEQIIRSFSLLIGQTNDPKLKGDLLMKLTDIKGYKKDQNNTKEEQVHYYLPLRCESCEFKIHNLTNAESK